ncbi:hypothetical protein BGZ70_009200 [Mortierella alpina]|uniref:ferric-chelate reductase (NADPH) n=1 Tax=Mortierella alpina TaxID=64518 RepID=A0A9P6J1S5_MORAP|nr:hypothetical protein BGZ70_009200 [Mortierella alpina]
MDHNHQTKATPWNSNLTYAADWCIVLFVPVVYLTGRHLVLLLTQAIARRRRHARVSHTHTLTTGNTASSGHHLTEQGDDDDDDQLHSQAQKSGVPRTADAEDSSSPLSPSVSFKRWTYRRIENWIVNKSSAALYLGPFIHLVAGATLLALIFLSILAVLLLTDVDLMRNSNRAGYLGLACIPFLFAFTGKNSIISLMTGLSHHRINQVHRFLGLCLVVLVSVHMGCMFYVWRPWQFLVDQQMATPKVRYGLATYATLCLMVVTAAWPVRRWAYEVFVVSHSLFLVFLVLVSYHTPYAMRFTAAGVVCYVINVLTGWCVRTHTAVALATVFSDRLTRLRMDRGVAHQAGQHIYVCVPSLSLLQWHPFTISSSSSSSSSSSLDASLERRTTMTVHARAVGGFTKRLCRWPENTQRRVILAGPYGEGVQVGRGLDVHKVVFVAAGSGLAYVMPILMDLLQSRQQQTNARAHADADADAGTGAGAVEVVWCVRDPGEVQWFEEELEMALDAAQGFGEMSERDKDKEDVDLIRSEGPQTRLTVRIHYTNDAFGDQESMAVSGPFSEAVAAAAMALEPMTTKRQESVESSTSTSTSTTATAETATGTRIDTQGRHVPFAGDERVEWVQRRLDVSRYVGTQMAETAADKVLEIVGCGPPLLLTQLHNVVARHEQLRGCRVELHTERFYV